MDEIPDLERLSVAEKDDLASHLKRDSHATDRV
jgi:hypothetical protein